MAFPTSPTVGQQYEKWEWNGTGWVQVVAAGGPMVWQKIRLVTVLDSLPVSAPWTGITYV